MNKGDQNIYRLKFYITGLFFLSFYILGYFFPEKFWAIHNPGILPPKVLIAIILVIIFLFASPFLNIKVVLNSEQKEFKKWQTNLLYFIISSLMAFLYIQFPIAKDFYGDAIYIYDAVDIKIDQWDNRLITEFLQPDWLNTKVGVRTFYQLNNFFTWLTGLDGAEVTKFLSGITGGIFAFIWMKFVDLHLTRSALKGLFIFIGLTAPFTTVFMGHYEAYSLSYTGIMIWISSIGIYFKSKSKKWLVALPFIFLFILQTHITNWLLFPGLIVTYGWHFRHKAIFEPVKRLDNIIRKIFPEFKGAFSWHGIAVYCFVPMIIIGAFSYFVIFANHDGPRQFSKEEFENTLFLPFYTDEAPPYDRYNLFSPAHFLDYFNLMFMWSGAILMLLFPPLTFLRKKIQWNSPLILIAGSSSIILFTIYFFLNPLLGAVIDWDLFATPGLIVLPFVVLLYAQLEKHIRIKSIAGPIIGLSLLSSTFLMVNTSPNLLSEHLEYIGKRNFKTYWIGCSTALNGSIELLEDRSEQQQKRLSYIKDLQPYAILGNDKEYASLLTEEGIFQRKIVNDKIKALEFFEKAKMYSPLLGKNVYYQAVTYFEMGDVEKAFNSVDLLAKIKYPPYRKTLKMAIHISLMAEEYQSAANYAVIFLKHWQDDPVIFEIEQRLRTGDRIESLVYLFKSK